MSLNFIWTYFDVNWNATVNIFHRHEGAWSSALADTHTLTMTVAQLQHEVVVTESLQGQIFVYSFIITCWKMDLPLMTWLRSDKLWNTLFKTDQMDPSKSIKLSKSASAEFNRKRLLVYACLQRFLLIFPDVTNCPKPLTGRPWEPHARRGKHYSQRILLWRFTHSNLISRPSAEDSWETMHIRFVCRRPLFTSQGHSVSCPAFLLLQIW